jgi:hypothetical protein
MLVAQDVSYYYDSLLSPPALPSTFACGIDIVTEGNFISPLLNALQISFIASYRPV